VAALDAARLHGRVVVGVTGPGGGLDPRAPASIRDAVPEDYEAFAQFFARAARARTIAERPHIRGAPGAARLHRR
jgi:hypothetical protein